MATFGRESVGGSNDNTGTTVAMGKKVTCPATGTLTNISLYTRLGANGNMTAWLYSDDGANNPVNKLATSNQIAVTTTAGWFDFTITYGLAATDYHVVWMADQTHYHYYDAVANASWYHGGLTYPNIDNPIAAHTHENKDISVHCDYTPSGGVSRVASRRLLVGVGLAAKTPKFQPRKVVPWKCPLPLYK